MIITTDFETYYSKTFSLSKMTTEEYIRDPQFQVIGVAVKVDDKPSVWASGTHEEIKEFLKGFPFERAAVLAHNTMFDGAILNWIFDIRPQILLDTLSMGRALHGVEAGGSLKAMAERYGLGDKGTEVLAAIGKRREDFSEEELSRYGDYCINDVELTYRLFHCLMEKGFPKNELKLIDLTLRMFTEPVIDLDLPLLEEHLGEVRQRREDLLKTCGVEDRGVLMSNPKFAQLLQSFGVEPPIKTSPLTGRETWAFAKNDEAFQALLEHPDDKVQALVAARLGNKSTLEETRTERFIEIAKRGPMPVPLRYYAAHTGRWGGADLINLQNLSARGAGAGKLKRTMRAPDGHVFIDSDSSQIEARVLAWLAGQEDAVETFRNNNEEIRAGVNKKNFQHDPYKLMASKIYGVPTTEVTDAQRFIGKTTILGSGYGMGAVKFQDALRVAGRREDIEECRRIVNTYREANQNIVALWAEAQAALIALYNKDAEKEFLGMHQAVRLVPDAPGLMLPSGLLIRYDGLEMESTDRGPQFSYAGRHGRKKIYGGKVVENCIAEGTLVLTDRGWVPIEKVAIEDKVHDGVEFVNHGGKVFKSFQPCVSIDGVWMTPDHEVLTNEGWKAASQNPQPYRPSIRGLSGAQSGVQQWSQTVLAFSVRVWDAVCKGGVRRNQRSQAWGNAKLRMQNSRVDISEKQDAWDEQASGVRGVALHAGPMPTLITPSVEKLWRAGHSCLRAMAARVYQFLGGHGAYLRSRVGFGPQGQQRPVFVGELSMGFSENQLYEQTKHGNSRGRSRAKSADRNIRIHSVLPTETRMANCSTDYTSVVQKPVYDILNAGPRTRFVVKGHEAPFVVHNCVQGLARCIIGDQMRLIARKYRVVLTVHDAIACVAPEAEVEAAQKYVEECMRWVPAWAEGLPVNCESGFGKTYGDC